MGSSDSKQNTNTNPGNRVEPQRTNTVQNPNRIDSTAKKIDRSGSNKMNLYLCGYGYMDLVPFFVKEEVKYKDGLARIKHPEIEWNYYLYEDFNENIVSSITIERETKENNKTNNAIICVINSIDDPCIELLIRHFSTLGESLWPFVIFVSNAIKDNQTLRTIIMQKKILYDIRKIYTVKHIYDELSKQLFKLCAYYNELGDEFIVNNKTIKVVDTYFASYINIMVIGAPGVGKSTLINKILGEQRCIAKLGVSITQVITKYHHRQYPLLLFDTPGFQNVNDQATLIDLIKEHHKTSETNNADNIHIILYVTNSSARCFKKEDIPFLQSLKTYNIPIVFPITRCQNDVISKDKVQSLANILKQNNIDNSFILGLNLVEPSRGYPELFKCLYNIFKPHKILNADVIQAKIEQGNIQDAINKYLKQTMFFNNIYNGMSLINRINNQIDLILHRYIKSKLNFYLNKDESF